MREKQSRNRYIKSDEEAILYIKSGVDILNLFLPITTSRNLVVSIMIIAGLPISRIILLTSVSERTVRELGRNIKSGLEIFQNVLTKKN